MIRLGSPTKSAVRCVAYSPDGRLVATGGEDRSVSLWELPGGQLAARLGKQEGAVYAVAFRPDGLALASGGGKADLRLWTLPDGEPLPIPACPFEGYVACLCYDAAGDTLAASSRHPGGGGSITGGGAAHWSPGKRAWKTLNAKDVYAVACAPQGDYLALALGPYSENAVAKDVIVLRPWAGKATATLPRRARVWSLAFSPDGAYLASAAGNDVDLQALDAADAVTLTGHERSVRAVAFAPSGDLLASGGLDGKVILWDVAERRLRASFDWDIGSVFGLAFAPDGMTLAVVGERGGVVVDVG